MWVHPLNLESLFEHHAKNTVQLLKVGNAFYNSLTSNIDKEYQLILKGLK